jgi:hypothetical protein
MRAVEKVWPADEQTQGNTVGEATARAKIEKSKVGTISATANDRFRTRMVLWVVCSDNSFIYVQCYVAI